MVTHQVDFDGLAARVVDALRREFPQDTIAVEPGYLGRAHVKIVSARFNGIDETAKQDLVWAILREALKEDAQDVAFVLPYGTDEL
jgi:stress-induced morphogen